MPSGGKISNEGFILSALPGHTLNVTAVLSKKLFRNRGDKEGLLTALKTLEADGLGHLEEVGRCSSNVVSHSLVM